MKDVIATVVGRELRVLTTRLLSLSDHDEVAHVFVFFLEIFSLEKRFNFFFNFERGFWKMVCGGLLHEIVHMNSMCKRYHLLCISREQQKQQSRCDDCCADVDECGERA